jgi:hypothetical protein
MEATNRRDTTMTTYATRGSLVTPLAIARVEYERYVLSAGYSEAGFQSLPAWIAGELKAMAKRGDKINGVRYWRGEGGDRYETRVDYAALAARVERALPTWRETYERVDGPVEVRS